MLIRSQDQCNLCPAFISCPLHHAETSWSIDLPPAKADSLICFCVNSAEPSWHLWYSVKTWSASWVSVLLRVQRGSCYRSEDGLTKQTDTDIPDQRELFEIEKKKWITGAVRKFMHTFSLTSAFKRINYFLMKSDLIGFQSVSATMNH